MSNLVSYEIATDDGRGVATVTMDDGKANALWIKFETTFVKGDANDVVRIFIDGTQKVRGASWESYYRFEEERNPSPTDRLLIRTAGTAAPAGTQGFLFDNVTSTSSHVDNPAPLNPPAPGPAGQNGTNGTNGTNGVNGKDGVTTVIVDHGALAGNTVRTLHARKIQGKTFVSLRASLRGKRLQVHGRSVKIDLRGRTVGTYNVVMVAKYKTKSTGKIHTERTIRSLSILRKYQELPSGSGGGQRRLDGKLRHKTHPTLLGCVLRSQIAANAASRTETR